PLQKGAGRRNRAFYGHLRSLRAPACAGAHHSFRSRDSRARRAADLDEVGSHGPGLGSISVRRATLLTPLNASSLFDSVVPPRGISVFDGGFVKTAIWLAIAVCPGLVCAP